MGLGQARGRRTEIRPTTRRFAAQIDADLAFRAAHNAHQFTLGALDVTAHTPAHRDLFLLLLLQVADLFSNGIRDRLPGDNCV